MEASGLDKTGTGDQTTYCRKTGLVAASSRRGISEQAAALGILRAGELVLGSGPVQGCTALGPRNAHVLACTLRFLRSGDAQSAFARDALQRFWRTSTRHSPLTPCACSPSKAG